MGDMNTSLPLGYAHGRNWFKSYPFTKQSLLLYNFLLENEMFCVNSEFKQNVNYTYFNADMRSYIDHVFLSQFCSDIVVSCLINEMILLTM